MTTEIARTQEGDHQSQWIAGLVLAPVGMLALGLFGGRVGRSTMLTLVGWCAIAALVVARRRRAEAAASSQMPPAELMACAVVAFIAALAFGVGGVAQGHGPVGNWTGVAAMLAALVGAWAFLAARVRERALDMVLEGVLGAMSIAVVFWSASVEPKLLAGEISGSMAAAHVVRVGLALVWVFASIRLARLSTSERLPVRVMVAGSVLVLCGEIVGLVSVLTTTNTQNLTTASIAITASGLLMVALALLHPAVVVEPPFVRTTPIRMSFGRLTIVIVAVLLVPGIAAWKLVPDSRVSLASLALCSALLSLTVVAYLAALLREWAKIERRSQHDELTGLPNRRQFHDRLADSLAQAERTGEHVAVMFLDLDRFKLVNDTLGHAAGNVLLMTVGKRLVESAAHGSMIARLQGDEFAILLRHAVDGKTSLAAANEVLSSIGQPVTIAKRKLHVSGSIGIAHFPQDGREPEALLRAADRAMYRAKELGRNRAQLHTADIQAKIEGRFDIESALHGAWNRDELRLLYQPKVDLRSGKVMGAEALMRWEHPQMGMISPADFIPIAEENGLIVELGEWALVTACNQLSKWEQQGFSDLTVSVNLSPRQFQLQRISDVVASVLRLTGVDPRRLELELTESLALQDPQMVQSSLNELRAMGVECSIDDFGTGWSGLSYLSHMPVTALKIDKSFVQAIIEDEAGPQQTGNQASIVLAIISMAKGLNMRVIAEGVETPAQLYFLLRNGCDQMQGNLFSPPVTAELFEQLVMLESVAGGQGRLGLATMSA
ncbi:MAG TPA: EAL domain-containing protein [Acidimicrobiales bacterium]|nr:EAL domain-containing protein [Acidimicrobiales bacterium]